MKKIIISFVCLFAWMVIFLFLLSWGFIFQDITSAPSWFTRRWQTVYVDGVGSFRIPTEWYVEQQDWILFITDKPREYEDYTLLIIGAVRIPGEPGSIYPHRHLESVVRGDGIVWIHNGILTNSVHVGLREYVIGEERIALVEIDMWPSGARGTARLLVWNRDVVDDETALEIARTFRLERRQNVSDIS